jgi:hypothetical protein
VADSLDEAKAAFQAAGERGRQPTDGLSPFRCLTALEWLESNSFQESLEHERIGVALSLCQKIRELLHVFPSMPYGAPAAFLVRWALHEKKQAGQCSAAC